MNRIFTLIAMWLLLALPVKAATPEQVDELIKLMELSEIIDVMREEGVDYGEELANEMFPSRANDWRLVVEKIYDGEWMNHTIRTRMAEELENTDVLALNTFFSQDPGRQIIALEVSARIALMDDAVEEASTQRVEEMVAEDAPRLRLIQRYVDANDLLENNVVGSMNSYFAFYSGMANAGGFPDAQTEEDMLRDVWSQEEAIRDDAREWLFAFLVLAYQPLSDDDLQSYISFSETPDGQDLNRALFSSFNGMFDLISRALGESAAMMMVGEDL